MAISLLLAKIMGAYLIVVAAGLFINKKNYNQTLEEFKGSAHMSIIFGFLALIIGLIVVFVHNLWVNDWRVVITILGWLVLIKGITYFIFPHWIVKTAIKFKQAALTAYLIPVFVLGIYLLYMGFVG